MQLMQRVQREVLKIDFTSLEWRKISDYLQTQRNRLVGDLLKSKEFGESERLKGRIEEIDVLLTEQDRPPDVRQSSGIYGEVAT